MNIKIIIDDIYKNRPARVYIEYAPTIRSERQGLKVMHCKEFGKLVSEKYQRMHDISRRIYSVDGLSPTIHTMQGGNTELKVAIQKIDIPQTVKVRKYPIDTNKLRECLRNHKNDSGLTNKDIAEMLRIPITKVEHWFRQDEYFAIPDAEIWFDLKQILGVTTDEFDAAVTTFEEKEGVYEKSERHYFTNGLSPTLTSMSGNEKFLIPNNTPLALDEQNNYIRTDGTVGTIMTDGSSPKHNNRVLEPFIVASRGRNPENPSDRTAGIKTEQRLEPNTQGISNTLTSVQKDNYVAEPLRGAAAITELLDPRLTPDERGRKSREMAKGYRIRKLTPKECWRLMGFSDEDFEKAEKVCSNSQLYKQAGNSIVVNVLMGIFWELLM